MKHRAHSYAQGQKAALVKLGLAPSNGDHPDQTYQSQAQAVSDLKTHGPQAEDIWNRFDQTMQNPNISPGTSEMRWV